MAPWVDVIGEALLRPDTAFPRAFLSERLLETFDVTGVSWNWQDSPVRLGFVITPTTLTVPREAQEEWAAGGLQNEHPLLRWHMATGDPAPQTSGRVPAAVVPRASSSRVLTTLRAIGCDQQLSLNCQLGPGTNRSFILARTGRDFSDDDLEVARRLRPALIGLHRHFTVLGTYPDAAAQAAAACGLTGRELAVLGLLADGLTAEAIGHRLAMSPRTAHKHLEHVYRKLGVKDRLNAVRVARGAGLLRAQPAHIMRSNTERTSSEPR